MTRSRLLGTTTALALFASLGLAVGISSAGAEQAATMPGAQSSIGDTGQLNNQMPMPANPSHQTDQTAIQNQSDAGTAAANPAAGSTAEGMPASEHQQQVLGADGQPQQQGDLAASGADAASDLPTTTQQTNQLVEPQAGVGADDDIAGGEAQASDDMGGAEGGVEVPSTTDAGGIPIAPAPDAQ